MIDRFAPTLPEDRKQMRRAKYTFHDVRRCSKCRVFIEWWKTTHGRWFAADVPQDATNEYEPVVPHAKTCKPREPKTESRQEELRQQRILASRQTAVDSLRITGNARIVVALYDDGAYAAYRPGLAAEDLRHELITEANAIARRMKGAIQ